MPHPIDAATETSPYGGLTRAEFYKSHQIVHREGFMLNSRNMKIFTQSWRQDSSGEPKGLVAMVHGYGCDSGWLNELTAVAIANAGFLVYALDLQGHGLSEGFPGHIPDIEPVIQDCIQFLDPIKSENPNLPAFLYGESLGGAVGILVCLQQKQQWDGLILMSPMCGISSKFKPMWPLEKLLPVVALIAPKWKVVVAKPVASKSYKEEWKRRLVARNPNRKFTGKPQAATALEFLRVCDHIKKHCHELEVGHLLVVHGGDDSVCDPEAARLVCESAAGKDKTMMVFPGMWHMLIGETKEHVELVFGTILDWLEGRAKIVKKEKKFWA